MNNRPTPPSFTFNRNELPTGDDGERLERIFRRIQTAIDARPQAPPPPPVNIDALAARLRSMLQAPGTTPLNLTALIPSGGSGSGADIEVTHAVRLSTYTPPTVAIGTRLFETDRRVSYVVTMNSSSVLVWSYAGGVMAGGTLANRPSDLGSEDIGFIFIDLTLITQYEWSGLAWFTSGGYIQSITNAASGTLTTVAIDQHLATSAATNGIAVGRRAQLTDDASATVDASELVTTATVAAAATFTTSWAVQLRSAGAALADFFRVRVSDIAFNIGGFLGILTHTNTADRTYTLPNATGTIDYSTAALTNDNFLLGGGTSLVKDAGYAIIPVAAGGTGVSNATQTYTPGLTNVSNLDASTAYQCQYFRVGNVVTVSGKVDVDPTTAGVSTSLGINLPIASNLGAIGDCAGVAFASGIAGQGAAIIADIAANRAQMEWVTTDVTNQPMYFSFTYLVI